MVDWLIDGGIGDLGIWGFLVLVLILGFGIFWWWIVELS